MAETNAHLPGNVPGQFPDTPGETDHDYIRDTGPYKTTTSAEQLDPDYIRNTGPYKTTTSAEQQDRSLADIDPKKVEEHYGRADGAEAVTTVGAGAGYPLARDDGNQVATDSTGRALTRDNVNSDAQDISTAQEVATAGGLGAAGATAASTSAWGPYDRAGKGLPATDSELESKFATYELNDPNPERTEQMKEYIRKIEEEKAAALGQSGEQPPEEKQGLLQKLRRSSKAKIEALTEGRRRSSATGSSEGRRRSSAAAPLAKPDDGHITIVKEGSHPDAPTLVVKEKPDDM